MEILSKKMLGFLVVATDGECGKICDFYFDHLTWQITDICVAYQLNSRKGHALVPMLFVNEINVASKVVKIDLQSDKVFRGPQIEKGQSVSKSYYNEYWDKYYLIPKRAAPIQFIGSYGPRTTEVKRNLELADRFYPIQKLRGFEVEAIDGNAGQVIGTTINCKDWIVQSILIRPSDLFGFLTKRIVGVQFIRLINWSKACVEIELPRENIQHLKKFSLRNTTESKKSTVIIDFAGKIKAKSPAVKLKPKNEISS